MKIQLVMFVLSVLFASTILAQEVKIKPLIGEWITSYDTNILGEGSETRVIFSKDGQNNYLTFKTNYFSARGKPPGKPTILGPYKIKNISNNNIIYVVEGMQYNITYRIHKERILEWGALVTEDNKNWRYAKEEPFRFRGIVRVKTGVATWTFSSDPFEIPVGKAQIPGLNLGTAFYIYEKIPSYQTGKTPIKAIRIMTRNEDKTLTEQFRMTWDNHGSPRFSGNFMSGGDLKFLFPTIAYPAQTKKAVE